MWPVFCGFLGFTSLSLDSPLRNDKRAVMMRAEQQVALQSLVGLSWVVYYPDLGSEASHCPASSSVSNFA
jgi:hypothetical protein